MFTLSADLRRAFPEAFAFALRASGLDARRLEAMPIDLEQACRSVRDALPPDAAVTDLPAIRVWREAYAAAGVKPSKFQSSIESLVRRAVKGKPPSIFPLVDAYNAISLRHLVPMGAADADRVDAPVALRLCRPDSDRFAPLGGDPADFPLKSTTPVYASGSAILCWCFNCRDAAPTALRPNTTNAVFFTEGVAAWQRAPATAALEELARLLIATGAQVEIEPFGQEP